MTLIAAADFRQRTVQPWCSGLVLAEADGTDAYLDQVISLMTTRIQDDLGDDFEPPSPDTDEVLEMDGVAGWRLYLPRRVRSITSVERRATDGTYTILDAGDYRLRKSLNTAGTAMVDGRRQDYLDDISGAWNFTNGLWYVGDDCVRITGKFGWAVCPPDIKRLVSLLTYDFVKAKADPLSNIAQRSTIDATIVYGEPREVVEISDRYRRRSQMVLG